MLDLDDPDGLGARRVAKPLAWLADSEFIDLASRRGAPLVVTLLSGTGNGKAFARGRGIYVGVPLGLWQRGWINKPSGSGLALLVVLLDLQGGKRFSASSPPSLPGPLRRRYGLSDDTWTRAGRELEALGLTRVKEPQGRNFDWRRMRNTYWIDKAVLNSPSRSHDGGVRVAFIAPIAELCTTVRPVEMPPHVRLSHQWSKREGDKCSTAVASITGACDFDVFRRLWFCVLRLSRRCSSVD